jgi:hypothetical protein
MWVVATEQVTSVDMESKLRVLVTKRLQKSETKLQG